MGEHNLLNPGFVGPLVNIHTGDTFYLPNFRASGGQLAGLPSLSYPRRDNVCSLPWTASESCNGYPQPYFSSAMSINPSFNRACEITRQDEGKCFYSNGGGNREPCAESANLKREERARGDSSSSITTEHGLHNGMGNNGTYSKYDYGVEQLTQDPPSCQSLESDSSSSLLNEGSKASTGIAQALTSAGNHAPSTAAGGELEGEFMLNEFITRQRRRELSDRLNLSDQQVKIWFQNRRMKKKRLMLREQALSFF
ncbi:unnamed protein product [Coregonus sp. 'balchen']|nr:unnamed protein product [Coregonus sp. 'balchen']